MQKKVERSFERVGAAVLSGLADIVRDGLFEIFRDSPHDDRSPSLTPAAITREPTPSISAVREYSTMTTDGAKDASMDLSYYLESDMPFSFGGLDDLDFTAPFEFGSSAECMEKESDSGYGSTGTGRGRFVETEM